jgi:hypothetical protein
METHKVSFYNTGILIFILLFLNFKFLSANSDEILSNDSLIRSSGSSSVYFLEDGKKRPILSEDVFNLYNFKWAHVITVDNINDYELGSPLANPNYRLVKYSNSSNVYLIENNKKRWIVNEDIFIFRRYGWGFIEIIDIDEEYITGEDIDDKIINGDLVKYSNSSNVYLIENNKKRLIVNEQIFMERGYLWSDIYIVLDSEFNFENGDMIGNSNKRIGLLYVSQNNETYNPEWRSKIEPILSKTKQVMSDLTDNKTDYTFEILGETETDKYCWNPAGMGFVQQSEYTKVDVSTNEIVSSFTTISNTRMPGSAFRWNSVTANLLTERNEIEDNREYFIKEVNTSYNDCPNCSLSPMEDKKDSMNEYLIENNIDNYYYTEYEENRLSMDCSKNDLSQWSVDFSDMESIKNIASRELNFSLDDYDDIIIIIGEFGQILASESEDNLNYRCSTMEGVIGGYSNLIFAENSLYSNGFIDCSNSTNAANSFYDGRGWIIIAHELLHHLGAVDVYNTGFSFGINSHLEEAQSLDPKYRESIMGDNMTPCMLDFEVNRDPLCTQYELDNYVYLDKLNRQKIGVE